MTARGVPDGYVTGRVSASLLGRTLTFETGPGLFSVDRIDDGTRALLGALPEEIDGPVLDVGCGYGALGLAIAAARGVEVTCSDRDALASAFTARNAARAGLGTVSVVAGVDVSAVVRTDHALALCNIPARIGERGIARLVEGMFGKLRAGGEVRIVVIRDLGPVVERLAAARGWRIEARIEAARHEVVALRPLQEAALRDPEDSYGLDEVTLETRSGPLTLSRFHDASEDPGHLREGLPLLLGCLPSRGNGAAISWRSGAGAVPVSLARSGFSVTAIDRDLLALDFVSKNAARAGAAVSTVASAVLDPVAVGSRSLVVGEPHPAYSPEIVRHELEVARRLANGGEVLWLLAEKTAKQLRERVTGATILGTRGRYAVLRASGITGKQARS